MQTLDVKSAAKNFIWLFADKAGRFVVMVVVSSLLARKMGPESWGLFNYIGSLVLLFGFLAMLGIDQWVVARLVVSPDKRPKLLATIATLRFIGSVIAILSAALLVKLSPNDAELGYLMVGIWAVLGYALDFPDLYFQSINKSKYSVIARGTGFLTANIARLIGIFLDFSLQFFIATIVVEAILVGLAQLIAFRIVAPEKLSFDGIFKEARSVAKHSWPLAGSSLLVLGYSKMDQILVMKLASDFQTGLYAASIRLYEYLNVFPIIFSISALPLIISVFRDGNPELNKNYKNVATVVGVASLATLLLPVALYLTAPLIIRALYGSAFSESVPVLRIVVWCFPIAFFGVVRQGLLLASNKLGICLALEALTLLLLFFFHLLFTAREGAYGAAIALLLTCITVNAVALISSKTIRNITRFYVMSLWECRGIRYSTFKKCVELLAISKPKS